MSEPTKDTLRKEINAILKDADLSEMSAKKVRLQLEEKLDCDLAARKKEVDELVMEFVNSKEDEEEEEEDSGEDSEEEEKTKKGKRAAASRGTPAKKKKKGGSSDESESDDDGSDEEYRPEKGGASKKSSVIRKRHYSESDSDKDWKRPKAAPKAKKSAAAGAKPKGKGTGFTRPYTLSPELAELMGAESLPRHEVVKKVWAIIKERNLYDPRNKQYAICDADLLKVMGVKRFRTFGMLKYLRNHFID